MLRPPHSALRPFIKNLWVSDHQRPPQLQRFSEYALPDGHMHVVIRLSGTPIRILDELHPAGHNYGYGVIGGARAGFYVREITGPAHAIGATLLPGAAQALFGLSALELANRHTSLGDVWGSQADALRERLLQLEQPDLQLELFEIFLMSRVPQVKGVHPAVAQALADIHAIADVRSMASRSGYSHRRFIELFGHSVGLTPKRFVRVQRFQSVLKRLAHSPGAPWTDLALDAGYSDQPHFNREFREFAGLTPEEYRRAAPDSPGHVLQPEDSAAQRRRK
jgi:AraC-like DNA-binding protein